MESTELMFYLIESKFVNVLSLSLTPAQCKCYCSEKQQIKLNKIYAFIESELLKSLAKLDEKSYGLLK